MTEPFTVSSEPLTAKRQWLISDPVELLIEHPMADRKRMFMIAGDDDHKLWAKALKGGEQSSHEYVPVIHAVYRLGGAVYIDKHYKAGGG
jgi:hypothetical protein